jgi:hypothetical protein
MAKWEVRTPYGTWEWECAEPWTAIYRTFKHGCDENDELFFVEEEGRPRYKGPDRITITVGRIG